mgnify:CR=1 FL=1
MHSWPERIQLAGIGNLAFRKNRHQLASLKRTRHCLEGRLHHRRILARRRNAARQHAPVLDDGAEIAADLGLSPRTIETIRQNMKTKVNAKTIGGLIMYGMRNKLIE